jgi:hypothetical protein
MDVEAPGQVSLVIRPDEHEETIRMRREEPILAQVGTIAFSFAPQVDLPGPLVFENSLYAGGA